MRFPPYYLLIGLFLNACATQDSIVTTSDQIKSDSTSEQLSQYYVLPNQMPQLIGGIANLMRYVHYPESARRSNFQGKVTVHFTVEENGDVVNLSVLNGPGDALNEEAIRVIRDHAKFIPGRKDGKNIPFVMSMPIIFRKHR
ncbi:MAG: energy transducer TonB [Bacteroidetes bacterium]|nr:energy transducer TonB [Bacteroidota bacterium]